MHLDGSLPVKKGRHSWKNTIDNTNLNVQGRCLDKPEQSVPARRERFILELPAVSCRSAVLLGSSFFKEIPNLNLSHRPRCNLTGGYAVL